MNEFGIILNTQEMRQIIRTISNHSRWIRHPSFPDKLTARFRLQSGMTELEEVLNEATAKATAQTPLRPNVVQPLGEHNTGNNVG